MRQQKISVQKVILLISTTKKKFQIGAAEPDTSCMALSSTNPWKGTQPVPGPTSTSRDDGDGWGRAGNPCETIQEYIHLLMQIYVATPQQSELS
jgi:hypothetical protein